MPYSDPEKQRASVKAAAQKFREKGVIPGVIPDKSNTPVIPVIPKTSNTGDTLRHIDYIAAKTFRAMTVADLRRAVPFPVKLDGQVIGVTRIDVEGAVDVT